MSSEPQPRSAGGDWQPCCAVPCELHGIMGCATCHHHEGECQFGSCEAPRVTWIEYLRADGSVATRDAACRKHADMLLECSKRGTVREPVFPRWVLEELAAGRITKAQADALLEQAWKDFAKIEAANLAARKRG